MMCTTTCQRCCITIDYNLEFMDSMPQLATSWSIPCTTHILTLREPQIM